MNILKNQFTKIALIAIFSAVSTTVFAQRRYHSHKRVKVEAVEVKTDRTVRQHQATTVTLMNGENNELKTIQSPNAAVSLETVNAVRIKPDVLKVVQAEKTNKTKSGKAKVEYKTINLSTSYFSETAKNSERLFRVQETEKTAMDTWLILVIAFGAAAVLFLILAIVFLLASFSYGLYFLFIILAILCFAATGVFLTLGLLGVMD